MVRAKEVARARAMIRAMQPNSAHNHCDVILFLLHSSARINHLIFLYLAPREIIVLYDGASRYYIV